MPSNSGSASTRVDEARLVEGWLVFPRAGELALATKLGASLKTLPVIIDEFSTFNPILGIA